MTTIDRIRLVLLEYPAGHLQDDKWGPNESGCLLTLVTSDGVEGHAVGRAGAGTAACTLAQFLERRVAPVLLGREIDAADHEHLWRDLHDMYQAHHVTTFALSVADVALWDLRGKLAGVPVSELMARQPRKVVQAYSSIPRLTDIEQAVEAAVAIVEEGFRAVKLHSAWNDPDYVHEVRLAGTVRERLPECDLMYDASRKLSRPDALFLAEGLQKLRYRWLEEPFGSFDRASFAWLRERTSIPLAAFESPPGAYLVAPLAAQHGSFDVMQVDCYWKGGITGALYTVQAARDAGLELGMHHGGSSSMNLANLHLAAAVEEIDMVEVLTPTTDYIQFMDVPPVCPGVGIEVPNAPGLGADPDAATVDRYRVEELDLRR